MRTIHIGVFTEDLDPKRLPEGWYSDGDSFLEWGEYDDDVRTPVHLMTDVGQRGLRHHPRAVETLRSLLAEHLRSGERFTDYVVETDSDDWSADVVVFLIDGTVLTDDFRAKDHSIRSARHTGPERWNGESEGYGACGVHGCRECT